ncbi:DUF4998 domain-containing protein [Pedobacter metabolipauper]|uniref:Uncharacterized protein DUF5000 n=1 Tax=Pedobacter metabolipauper TaxID=425513 RepID=A0A4R6SUN8_9SPHI|nr:DUF4998 domain-containing protein [Pedobacter metabolipauper]TDQ08131.1 uncharacterized protein DUF5000 [Pedobacter metabolipauper]
MKIYLKVLFLAVAGLSFLASCTKEDDYKKFQEGGEIIYAGTLDTVIAQAGKNRINLLMNLGSDASVTKIKVFWNDGSDSAQVAVARPAASDIVNLLIPNLETGTYNFKVYTYDSQNNSSVVRNVSGIAYGNEYESSLVNRRINSAVPSAQVDSLVFTWNEPNPGLISTEIRYAKKNGDLVSVIVPATQTITKITEDYLAGSTLSYRSTYKYDVNAFDTYTVPEFLTLTLNALPPFERQLPKSAFKEVILPTDVLEGGFGWLMPALWNGVYTGSGFATTPGVALPVWFTFDTGVSTKINRFLYYMPQDRIFRLEAVKSFEIWGSDSPAADGSWASWTLLRTCVSIKPSGSPVGTNTAADIAAAAAGQEFVMPDGIPKTRYIRIKVLSNWGNGAFQAMGEFTFYTRDRVAK